MENIRFRLAKPCDAKQIADCHWHVRDRYTRGIFLSVGKSFLRTYYEIILNEPYEVVVCAERNDGLIVGFGSATLDAAKQAESLKRHKIKLGFSAIVSIVKKPSLLRELWIRFKSLSQNNDTAKFTFSEGVRGDYWCWRKDIDDSSFMSVDLERRKDGIIYNLGYDEMFFEVDKANKAVYRYHEKIAKAVPIETIILPDGRERVLFRKRLKPYRKMDL